MQNDSNADARTGRRSARIVRWTARGISVVVLLVWGFFIAADVIGSLFGESGDASRPLTSADYSGLVAMGAWLVGLALAWKWELVGGAVVLVAFVASAALNPNVLSIPFALIPTAGILFVASSWLHRQSD